MQTNATLRHDYTLTEIAALYEQPLDRGTKTL